MLLGFIWGAFTYRARGGAFFKLPNPLWDALFAASYGLTIFLMSGIWWAALVVWGLTTAASTAGHSSYQGMGSYGYASADGDRDEWYGRGLSDLPISDYWHDFAGLTLKGLMITTSCAVALAYYGHPLEAAFVLSSAVLLPVCYTIGWRIQSAFNHLARVDPIMPAELLSGAFLTLTLAIFI